MVILNNNQILYLEIINEDIYFQVLQNSGHLNSVSQMPVILIPLHFDRDQALRIPSCQRSVVLRPFCTQDFMTGIPALPGKELPVDVCISFKQYIVFSCLDLSMKIFFQKVNTIIKNIAKI